MFQKRKNYSTDMSTQNEIGIIKVSDEELLDELRRRMMANIRSLDEFKHLTNELKIVNKKLEESEAMKSHFISNITNEIVNPFTSILGLSRAILSVDKENWKKVLSMVALIHSEAFELDFQLKNIFAAAKIEAGEIFPETSRVEIRSLMKSLIDSFVLEAKKKKLVFDFVFDIKTDENETFYFKTDAEKLKLILSNLLANAIKYSHPEDSINLKAWIEDDVLFASVQDFGIGVSEENQHIIFDRFKRVDSGISSINRGHGLGLSINKALLDILGGTISLKSEFGKGATFTISIPQAVEDSFLTASDGNEIFFDDNDVF